MIFLQLDDPLELFVKRSEFILGSWFLSRRDMILAVESDVKPHSFLPSFFELTLCPPSCCSASVSAATDSRIVLMNEILSGIRLIKIQCWEKLYGDQIEEMRR